MLPEVNVVKDVSTVVSLLQYDLTVNIPTVFPGTYTIPKCSYGDFSFICVGRARTDMYVDSDRGFFSRPILSEEIAQSIVRDHINSQICVVRNEAQPGIFMMPGEVHTVLIAASPQLQVAREMHKNWYIKIVEQADTDFRRTGSTRAVGALAKFAVKALNIHREWDTDQVVENAQIMKCPMCTALVHPGAVVCMTCKYILDEERYKEMKSRVATG